MAFAWSELALPTSSNTFVPRDACWADGLGLFLIVGNRTSGSLRVLTSPDGQTWTYQTAASASTWRSVAYASALNRVVAVGSGVAMWSDDGTTWSSATLLPEANNWTAVCWSSALALFVAVANTGTHRVMTSADGKSWTVQSAASAKSWSGIAASATGLVSVAFSVANNTQLVQTSTDGATWALVTHASISTLDAEGTGSHRIAYSPDLGMFAFAAANSSGTAIMMTSTNDGATWTSQSVTASSGALGGATWLTGQSSWIVFRNAFGYETSADGVIWTHSDWPNTFARTYAFGAWSSSLAVVTAPDVTSHDTLAYGLYESVTGLSPAVGTRRGGTVVTITGIGLSGVTSVTFGGTAAVSVIASATSIRCVTPPHAIGLVDVVITGVGMLSSAFSFISVDRVSPRSGTFAGGTSVTISGYGFNDATGVVFDPAGTADAATDVVIVSNTTITCTTPVHALGRVDVHVVGVETGTDLYTYVVPSITLPPIPYLAPPALGQGGQGSSSDVTALMVKPWLSWLRTVKKTIEDGPTTPVPAEQVIGTFPVSSIPDLPWTKILKAGSSLGDLETRSASDLSSGTLAVARLPALSGDATAGAGTGVTVLATVNSSPGSYGSGTKIPIVTVNGKGLVTNVLEQPIQTGALTRANDTNVTLTLTGTPATALLKDVLITAGWSGTLAVTRGGTGTGTTFTAGSVVFAGASGVYTQDNAHLFWDDANNRLGVGTATPGAVMAIVGSGTPSSLTGSPLQVTVNDSPFSSASIVRFENNATGANDGVRLDILCGNTAGSFLYGSIQAKSPGQADPTFLVGSGTAHDFVLVTAGSEVLRLKQGAYFLSFGGQTTSFPASKRESANWAFRLGDDSAYTGIIASKFYAGGTNVYWQANGTTLLQAQKASGYAGLDVGPVQITANDVLTNKCLYFTGTLTHSSPAAVYMDGLAMTGISGSAQGAYLNPSFSLGGNATDTATLWLQQPTVTLNGHTLTNASTLFIGGAPSNGTNKRAVWVAGGLSQFDGAMQFGTHSAIGVETVTGYITITDSGGTSRKLAVVS